jgi:cyclic beta-1,2-glucan synthetase
VGHFYNWYDTKSLRPLKPLYVSSVDSGNLAGHLLTLRQGLLSLPDQKITGPRLVQGIEDTLQILIEQSSKPIPDQVVQFRNYVNERINEPPVTLVDFIDSLKKLSVLSAEIANAIPANAEKKSLLSDKKIKGSRSLSPAP